MGEGNHTSTDRATKTDLPRRGKLKWSLIVGGTCFAILVTGVVFQIYHAEQGSAGQEQAAQPTTQQPGVARVQQQQSHTEAVARVGGDLLISQEELARECLAIYGKEVLENLINRAIIHRACEQNGVVVTAEEIHKEVAKIAKDFNLSVDNWYQVLQSERNLSPMQYQKDVIWPMLALRKLAGEHAEVAERDIQRAFQRDYGPRVKARMIVFDNLRRAQDVWQQAVNTPDDFDRLAREHSVDAHSRALGGKILPVRRYSGNEELEKTAFRLKEGEISGIIQLDTKHYAFLLCEGRTETLIDESEIDQVRDLLVESLTKEKIQESVAEVFQKIKEGTRVDNYITGVSTGGDVQQVSGAADGGGVRQAGGISYP